MAAEEDYLGLTSEERRELRWALGSSEQPDDVQPTNGSRHERCRKLHGEGRLRRHTDGVFEWFETTDLGRLALRVDAMIGQEDWA